MKKETILGLIAVMVTAFTINLAKANTESGDSSGYSCSISNNICYMIEINGKLIAPRGTLLVNY